MGAPIPNDARLKGPFKPMRFEATVPDCIVTEGEIPKDLCGGFYRNGPTWRRPTKQGTNGTSPRTGWSRGSSSKTGALTFATAESAPRSFFPKQRHGSGLFEWADGKFTDWRAMGFGEVKRDETTTGIPHGTNNINVFPFQGQVVASGEQGGPPIALHPETLEGRFRPGAKWATRRRCAPGEKPTPLRPWNPRRASRR